MNKQLLLAVFFVQLAHASELTVQQALQVPTQKQISYALKARGGTYTEKAGHEIQKRIHDILRAGQEHVPPIKPTEPSYTKEIANLLLKMPKYLPPASYTTLMKGLVSSLQTVHTSIALKKNQMKSEDTELSTSPLLQTAHYFAIKAVLNLLFIMYSPKAYPCERMHALYTLNTVSLLGSQGVAFRRFRARANRFYFTPQGQLKEFDPSRNNAQIEKRVKALARFIRTISDSKTEHLNLLNKGIHSGIPHLYTYYAQASQSGWSPMKKGFIWRYAAGLFKELTTIDVIKIRTVDPSRIFSHQENKVLLKLMMLFSLNNHKKAEQVLARYKNTTTTGAHIIERYYNLACSRSTFQQTHY